MNDNNEFCRRFLFADTSVRGEYVSLDKSLDSIFSFRHYPPVIQTLLAEALVAAALMADTIKLSGSLIMQLQGNGPVSTLVAQANHLGEVRGLAIWDETVSFDGQSFRELVGDGRLVITLDGADSERYQGIVEISGESIAQCLSDYFEQSEQLPTRFWLAVSTDNNLSELSIQQSGVKARGLMLQQLPIEEGMTSDWQHLNAITATLSSTELLELPCEELLYRLYHEDSIQLFTAEPLTFSCSCSAQKVESTLLQLGQAEVEAILQKEGVISVDCEFCNQQYQYDAIDAAALFVANTEVTNSIQ